MSSAEGGYQIGYSMILYCIRRCLTCRLVCSRQLPACGTARSGKTCLNPNPNVGVPCTPQPWLARGGTGMILWGFHQHCVFALLSRVIIFYFTAFVSLAEYYFCFLWVFPSAFCPATLTRQAVNYPKTFSLLRALSSRYLHFSASRLEQRPHTFLTNCQCAD